MTSASAQCDKTLLESCLETGENLTMNWLVIYNTKFGLGDKEGDRVALVSHVGERSNARRIFVEKPEVKNLPIVAIDVTTSGPLTVTCD